MWQLRDTDSGEVVQTIREHEVLEVDALTVTADQGGLTLSGPRARVNEVGVELPYGLRPGDLIDTGSRRLRLEQDSAATLLRDPDQWWLVGQSEEVAGLRVPIADERIVIGREEDCDIVLDEGHVSRHHAHIERLIDGVWLTDLASRNGTYVDGERLHGACRLRGGEELCFDQTRFVTERVSEPDDPNRTLIRAPAAEVVDLAAGAVDPAPGTDERTDRAPAGPTPTAGEDASPRETRDPPPTPGPPASSLPIADQPTVITTTAPLSDQPTVVDLPNVTPPEPARSRADSSAASSTGDAAIEATVQMDATSQPVMIVNGGPIHGRVFPIRPGRVTIGRSEDCDVVIPERSVSSRHAQLEYRPPGRFTVSNLISSNGIFVNGTRVESAQLGSGDVISLGRVELLFAEGAAAARQIQRQLIEPRRGLPNWIYAILAFAATIGVMVAGFVALTYFGYVN